LHHVFEERVVVFHERIFLGVLSIVWYSPVIDSKNSGKT